MSETGPLISTQPSQPEPLPPLQPAVLLSEDGQIRFSLYLLRWETALLPCTRYDEWLVCRFELEAPAVSCVLEGPFLLRFEVEEIFRAVCQAMQGSPAPFASDFLEPVLNLQLHIPAAGKGVQFRITMTPPAGEFLTADASSQKVIFTPSSDSLDAFRCALGEQLDSFLSLL